MRRILAMVSLGMIMGAVAMNLFLAGRVDQLLIERERLRVDYYNALERLKRTEARWQSHRATVIKEIAVQFDTPAEDPFLELALREAIARLVENLIGEELETLSPSLAVHLLDGRIVEADGKHYRLHVRTLIMTERLTYILHYEPAASDDSEP